MSGTLNSAAPTTVPTLVAEFFIDEGKNKDGKPFVAITMQSARGDLKGLRQAEWSVLHDVLPDSPFREKLGKALVALSLKRSSGSSVVRTRVE